MKSLGKHLIVELYGCSYEQINDLAQVEKTLIEAVQLSKATIIQPVFHQFSPHGVSGVVIIAESHFSIHTWPEYGYAAVDLFTCGTSVDTWKAFDLVKTAFGATRVDVKDMPRGILSQAELARAADQAA